MYKVKKYILGIFIFSTLAFAFSCSLSKPNVPQLAVKLLEVENDSDILIERLSVFIHFIDENGRDDYNSMSIIHKESGLSWTLNRNNSSFFISEQYTEEENQKRLWIGSNKFAYPLGKIPLGEYSIIIEDLAGNRVIKNFSLKSKADFVDLPFEFTTTSDSWRIKNKADNKFNNYSLILLGADKQPIFVKEIGAINSAEMSDTLADLRKQYSDARYIQCLGENSQKTIGYLSKSYKLY